jgi:hypothetical protein
VHKITERAAFGAAFLDEKRPGWWQLINLGTLDLQDGCTCIGGQLAGAGQLYVHFVTELGLSYSDEIEYGFDGDEDGSEYEALTAAWRDLIARRREDAGVPK